MNKYRDFDNYLKEYPSEDGYFGKYGGNVSYKAEDGWFRLNILIPM